MASQFVRRVARLSLEEKILNGASILAFVAVFFPWVGGEWLGGKPVVHNGLGFFTSFIGISILIFHLYVILVTLIPLTTGAELIRRGNKNAVRLSITLLASIMTIAIWSVITKFTFEFSRLQIHFGLYLTLIGSLVSTLYSFLLLQDNKRGAVNDLFSHDDTPATDIQVNPPPPNPEPEEHRIY